VLFFIFLQAPIKEEEIWKQMKFIYLYNGHEASKGYRSLIPKTIETQEDSGMIEEQGKLKLEGLSQKGS
jgi:hypothetical protein